MKFFFLIFIVLGFNSALVGKDAVYTESEFIGKPKNIPELIGFTIVNNSENPVCVISSQAPSSARGANLILTTTAGRPIKPKVEIFMVVYPTKELPNFIFIPKKGEHISLHSIKDEYKIKSHKESFNVKFFYDWINCDELIGDENLEFDDIKDRLTRVTYSTKYEPNAKK